MHLKHLVNYTYDIYVYIFIQVYEGDERLVATVYPNVDYAFIVTLIFIFDLINNGGTAI